MERKIGKSYVDAFWDLRNTLTWHLPWITRRKIRKECMSVCRKISNQTELTYYSLLNLIDACLALEAENRKDYFLKFLAALGVKVQETESEKCKCSLW